MELLLLRSFDAAAVRMELVAAAVVRPAHTGTRSAAEEDAAVRAELVAALVRPAQVGGPRRWLLPSIDLLTQALAPQWGKPPQCERSWLLPSFDLLR